LFLDADTANNVEVVESRKSSTAEAVHVLSEKSEIQHDVLLEKSEIKQSK